MRSERASREGERAVSPVIGIILIVAITVVLAGVISLFVVDAADTVQENIKAGASVTETDNNEVQVVWTSNQNANKIEVDVSGCVTDTTMLNSVGESYTSNSCSSGASADVIVTAIGDEDAETVIASETVEF